ncbi:MAG: RdgB/HAM1 family non-canonical purine NTP pyrophosphatase [Nanobdellota archaeon]
MIFITGNEHKLREAQQILGEIENVKIDLPELQGDVEEIVKEKAKIACEKIKKPVFVDDTSLCFNAFNGMPGPYIKFFVTNMKKKDIAKMLDSFEDKTATAICAIGYCFPENEPECVLGKVKGKIVYPIKDSKFGWDPIFQPEGYEKTYAEMDVKEKNAISHRRKALELLKEKVFQQ